MKANCFEALLNCASSESSLNFQVRECHCKHFFIVVCLAGQNLELVKQAIIK